jgi:ABC-type Zn uptake system ZnuABC Zn-binding protein ZnuA
MNQSLRLLVIFIVLALSACAPQAAQTPAQTGQLRVLAVEGFLADLTRQVAGERALVESLIPDGLDPHAFTPAPGDVARIADAQLLVVNGAGLESWLQETLDNAGGTRQVIEASAGLQSRTPQAGEIVEGGGDPHFWLDPTLAVRYVENIRDGLILADPAGKETYTRNTAAYITQLKELDAWIKTQIEQIPVEKRLIVTNHESFGYYADRYGLRILGTIIPSVSTGSAPSAQQMANLIDSIRQSGATAIFLETGANPKLAEQIAAETGVVVISDLYTHSLTAADGPAPTYLQMMRYNTSRIVEVLK